MEPSTLGVPKIIYESIEDILEAQVRRLAIDIAKTLGVNEKLLLSELKKDKIKTYLFDDDVDIDMLRCKAYNLHEYVYIPCEQPIVYKKDFCLEHLLHHTLKDDIKDVDILSVLYIDGTQYYRNIKNKVYNTEFKIVGVYNPDKKEICKFVLEE